MFVDDAEPDAAGMPTTSCPFSIADDQSCPALQPAGACAEPAEVTQLVRAAISATVADGGLDAANVDVALECASPGALRLVLRGDGLSGRIAHRAGVRALDGLCAGAKAADKISVSAESLSA